MKKAGILLLVGLILFMSGCTQNKPATTQTETPASVQTSSPSAAPAPAAPAADTAVNAGLDLYTGAAMGFAGIVEVTLEVKDKVIVSVIAVGNDETIEIGTLALDNMPGMMVAANSIEVDMISGASFTSKAVLDAAAIALTKAGLTNADLSH
jgi:fumarate reductase flavoprotein subunit